MRSFEVSKHPTLGIEAVKRGFSWPAFIVPPFIWMLAKMLWKHAGVWLLAVISVSTLVSSLENAQSAMGKIAFIALLLTDLAVWLAPACQGNRWRARDLMARGYELLGTVEASSSTEAVDQLAPQQRAAGDVRNARA